MAMTADQFSLSSAAQVDENYDGQRGICEKWYDDIRQQSHAIEDKLMMMNSIAQYYISLLSGFYQNRNPNINKGRHPKKKKYV